MPAHDFVSPDSIRAQFSAAMSLMYKQEVPLYGTLLELVSEINQQVMAQQPKVAEALRWTGEIERLPLALEGVIKTALTLVQIAERALTAAGCIAGGVAPVLLIGVIPEHRVLAVGLSRAVQFGKRQRVRPARLVTYPDGLQRALPAAIGVGEIGVEKILPEKILRGRLHCRNPSKT